MGHQPPTTSGYFKTANSGVCVCLQLAHALSVFAVHARGPLFDQYTAQLEKECDRYWKNGRQMCEVLSLTGNPCTNPLHRGGGEGAGGGELQEEANKILDDTDPPERFDMFIYSTL